MASNGDNGSNKGTPPTVAVVGVIVIVCFTISAVFGLAVAGRPLDNVIYLLSGLAAPTIAGLLAIRKLDNNTKDLQQVQRQVNGKMDNLISDKASLENQVHTLGGTPVTLPGPRHAEPDTTSIKDEASNG